MLGLPQLLTIAMQVFSTSSKTLAEEYLSILHVNFETLYLSKNGLSLFIRYG